MTMINNSTSAFYERSSLDIGTLRKQTEALQSQLSSGDRLTKSSDNPVVASRLRSLARAESLSQIDMSNANRATADLNLTDHALSSFTDYVIRAKDIATQAASGTLNAQQRAGLGIELDQMVSSLVALANSRDSSGHSLFGGQTTTDPYAIDGSGNVVYSGVGDAGEISLGEGQTVKRGLTGPEFLNFTDPNGNPTDLIKVVKDLAGALQGDVADPAAAARDGIDALTKSLDQITTNQTVVGSRLAWIDLTVTQRTDAGELRAAEEEDIGKIDIASTMTQLQQALTVLEASQASFTKLSSLTLFDMLR